MSNYIIHEQVVSMKYYLNSTIVPILVILALLSIIVSIILIKLNKNSNEEK